MSIKSNFVKSIIAVAISQSLLLPPALADNQVRIAGAPIFTVPSAGSAASVSERTKTIQENLDNALVAAKDRSPSSVNIAYVNGMPVITLGGYQVVTINSFDVSYASTPASLANEWANKIRQALVNQAAVNTYVSQLSGNFAASAPPVKPDMPSSQTNPSSGNQPGYDQYNTNTVRPNGNGNTNTRTNPGPNTNNTSGYNPDYGQNPQTGYAPGGNTGTGGPGYRQGRITYAPAGQIIPVSLITSIATQVARPGDLIMANITQNINVGDSVIPAGSQVIGQVASAEAGRRLARSGELQIKFTTLRLPDGAQSPISAHIVGGIGKYAAGTEQDQFKGETMKNKVGSVAFRGLLGAGGGAALGTAVGAIAGGGHGAGMGAWSGAAIGGGLGAADSLLLRKGTDITVPSGTNIQLQLDAPVSISGTTTGYQ